MILILVLPLQVCPVCAMRVGVDMVAHITLQHGNIFKISFYLRLRCQIYFSFLEFLVHCYFIIPFLSRSLYFFLSFGVL